MAILETTDFTGKWQVAVDQYSQAKLQTYIDDLAPSLMAKLFGATLSQAIIADIDTGTEPSDPLFLAIFNPFIYDNVNCYGKNIVVESKGVKAFLKGIIYFEIMKDSRVSAASATGTTSPKQELSLTQFAPFPQTYDRYNEAVKTANAIRWYIQEHSSDYSDFNGETFRYNYLQ